MPRLFDNPITYQTRWLNSASSSMPGTNYFDAINFDKVIFSNTSEQTALTNANFKKNNNKKDASITFNFTPTTNDSYYLTLGNFLDKDNVEFLINDRILHNYTIFRHTTIINVANQAKGKNISITARFKKNTLWLNNFVLYRMNNNLVKEKINQIKKHDWKINQHSATKISGTIDVSKANQWFATTIPYNQGWHAYVDGKKVHIREIQQTFIGFPISTGKHNITFVYIPPYLYQGIFITCLSFVVLFGTDFIRKKLNNS